MQTFFEHSYWIYLCYVCLYTIAVPTFVLSLHLRRMTSEYEVNELLLGKNAAHTSPTNGMIVYEWTDNVKTVTWFMLFLLVAFFFLGTSLFVVAYVKITSKL